MSTYKLLIGGTKKARTPTPLQPEVLCCSEPIGDLRNGPLESFMAAMVTHVGSRDTAAMRPSDALRSAAMRRLCAPFDCPFGAAAATRACNSMPMSSMCTHGDLIHIFLYISLRISYSHFSPFIIYKLICCLHISIGIPYSYFFIDL